MVVFSQNLNQSLGRAIAMAEKQFYNRAPPEHVLLALIDDPDVIPVLQACNVDLAKLRDAVEASMPHSDYILDQDEGDTPDSADDDASDPDEDDTSEPPDPIPVQHFRVVIERAIDHAETSGCEDVNSADVLVALLAGPVGDLMNEHGLTRYDVTTFISHGITKDANAMPGGGVVNRALSGDGANSLMHKVCLLNDNYTSMDFAVQVLKEIFELAPEDAEEMMLRIHNEGSAACGTFAREEAEARAARVMELARERQQPLRCVLEEIGP